MEEKYSMQRNAKILSKKNKLVVKIIKNVVLIWGNFAHSVHQLANFFARVSIRGKILLADSFFGEDAKT